MLQIDSIKQTSEVDNKSNKLKGSGMLCCSSNWGLDKLKQNIKRKDRENIDRENLTKQKLHTCSMKWNHGSMEPSIN